MATLTDAQRQLLHDHRAAVLHVDNGEAREAPCAHSTWRAVDEVVALPQAAPAAFVISALAALTWWDHCWQWRS
ncbi:hypothetical protein N0V85_003769 [Neurospora sp. IMI 360204]|nr:hypothetical protein N0V85_003769 [Neurospora sp. IMI 360204]